MATAAPFTDRIDRTAEVVDRFRRLPLKQGVLADIELVTDAFVDFAENLAHTIPQGRSASMAFTALQEAKFWANDALAHDAGSAAS